MRGVVSRLHWMDFLRGAAVLLVVVMHANEHGGASVGWWTEANEYLRPFRMPLLMFLSGTLLDRSLGKPLRVYASGKAAAVLWPLAIWMAIYGLFVRGGVGLPENILVYLITGDYLWFLITLLACYAGAVVFKPLAGLRDGPRHGAYLVGSAVLLLPFLPGSIAAAVAGHAVWYGAFFFLGAWAGRFVEVWMRTPWMVALPLLLTVAVYSYHRVDHGAPAIGTPAALALSVGGVVSLVWLASRLPHSAFVSFFAWCGRNSIVVYVAHFPILILLRGAVFSRLPLSGPVHVTLMTATVLTLTCLLVWARPWTPWLYALPRPARSRRPAPDGAVAAIR